MKKAFNQTVRDIKREVNKKVLKVPGIEQKVLDATSNEAWGPHGTLLADIAHASRNYHECQIIMAVIWKRINDTGKNWRHVYKALTVLDYLVANGSERVIDEIKEHSYQISTLSGFHYIDSSGRDQGTNVRKKSLSLVDLVNDKERIIEVREKAAANKDKFRTTPGGMYRPGSYDGRYDDEPYEGRYGNGDDETNGRSGYGRQREYNYRDDDRYGRENDHYGRDVEERYNYRDDDHRGRSRSVDDYSSRRSRSSERDKNGVDEDAQYADRGLERKFSVQNISEPPTYEEAVGESVTSAPTERNGEIPKPVTPIVSVIAPPSVSNNQNLTASTASVSGPASGNEFEPFDEFDPRGPFSAEPAPVASSQPSASLASDGSATDLLGSLSDPISANPLAIMPISSMATSEQQMSHQAIDDPFGDSPFKAISSPDLDPLPNSNPSIDLSAVYTSSAETDHNSNPYFSATPQTQPKDLPFSADETDILAGILPPTAHQPGPPNPLDKPLHYNAFEDPTLHFNNGILMNQVGAQIPSMQPVGSQIPAMQPVGSQVPSMQPVGSQIPSVQPVGSQIPSMQQAGGQIPSMQQAGGQIPSMQQAQIPFMQQAGAQIPSMQQAHIPSMQQAGAQIPSMQQVGAQIPSMQQVGAQIPSMQQVGGQIPSMQQVGGQIPSMQQVGAQIPSMQLVGAQIPSSIFGVGVQSNYQLAPQQSFPLPVSSQTPIQSSPSLNSLDLDVLPQAGINPLVTQSSAPSLGVSMAVPQIKKFETKSSVWTDTLTRGLVNLDISGPKTNSLADIGVDFDAINRKEKRMEKQPPTPVISTVTMGKAMGSGSGIGRAGASAMRPQPQPQPQNPVVVGYGNMNLAPGIGMPGNMNPGMGMPGNINPGMGMIGNMNPGMGMGSNMNQGLPVRPPAPYGGYNPMMGAGGYGYQQPYR